MKLYVFKKQLLLVFIFCISLCTLAKLKDPTTVFITGDLINNSKLIWVPNYLLVYPDGSSHGIRFNIAPDVTPAKGRFMIPEQVGSSDYIYLEATAGPQHNWVKICTFLVKADDPYHASMTLTSADNNMSEKCNYTGDPNNNTAAITISDN